MSDISLSTRSNRSIFVSPTKGDTSDILFMLSRKPLGW